MIDNGTLMVAIAFSSAALMITLIIGWLGSRRDTHMLSWALSMIFVVAALSTTSTREDPFNTWQQIGSYTALLTGMGFIYQGASLFRTGHAPTAMIAAVWLTSVLALGLAFRLGYAGLGTIVLNLACAAAMFGSAAQYWRARAEAPLHLAAMAALYAGTGVSFLACALVLMFEGRMVLHVPPSNWAEEINSLMIIVGITGIGALSLTLNQSRATRRHRQEALTDPMTGLLNRRALFDRFDTARLETGTAILMFDIDHFKRINDLRGHAAGDAVITHFAAILRENMRPEDTAARIGGEEFCAILPAMTLERAKAVAEAVRASFESRPAPLESGAISATTSVGVATCGAEETFSSVLNRADNALYKAKDSGRNTVTTAPLRLIA
ncbi:diguanylate cyclase [Devosia sp.]|uniref:GGDEF domain-containing protein n=1 Tax=Devosia sp. TaxID=1871048 RepID=UPI002AFEED22|nr:diguanylate cyclase [Devosia sp.]